jgi:hypothetical protein
LYTRRRRRVPVAALTGSLASAIMGGAMSTESWRPDGS